MNKQGAKIYDLGDYQRFLNYPYQLQQIGWMPHHQHFHNNDQVEGCFVCMACNYENDTETIINGQKICRPAIRMPTLSFLVPGTVLKTVKSAYHDEIFFHYKPESTPAMMKFAGEKLCAGLRLHFQGFPRDILMEIRQELNNFGSPGCADRLDLLAIKLISEIFLQSFAYDESSEGQTLKLHSIAARLSQGEKLPDLLKQHSLSERSFYREWKKYMGISPKEYVLKNRLERACSLLTGSDLAVSQIGERCGFGSATQFYKLFRQQFGMTPLKFRDSQKHTLFPVMELPFNQ